MAHNLAATLTDIQTGTVGSLRDAVARTMTRIRDGLARHRVYANIRYELAALNDRELADIGIMRSEIDAVARDHADNR